MLIYDITPDTAIDVYATLRHAGFAVMSGDAF